MNLNHQPTLGSLLDPRFTADRLIASGMSQHEAIAKGKRFAQAALSLITGGSGPEAKAIARLCAGPN